MTSHNHRILRKRDGYLSGSVVEGVPTPTASALAQNSAAATDSNSGIPLLGSSVAQNAPTSAASSSPTTSATSSTASSNQISLGAVIGACIAAFIALILALVLAFYCSRRHKRAKAYSNSRNTVNNTSRRRSHLEPWKRMDDKGEGQEQPMQQRPPSGPLGAMFHRTVSNTSGEKSSEGHNREEVGSMHHFAKYHPGLAVEMASQATTASVDDKVAKPSPVLRLPSRGADMTPPLSWDRDTVGGESYMSAQSDLSKSTTPLMMATAKSTPPATTSPLHHWESAEVLHATQLGSDFSEPRGLQNPFSDSASSVRGIPRGQNPFFSGRDQTVRRTLLPPHENPFADSNATRDSAAAIQSLIAALEVPMDRGGNRRIISVQSSVYSRMTGDDGDSTIDFTAFPYPPTSQTNTR